MDAWHSRNREERQQTIPRVDLAKPAASETASPSFDSEAEGGGSSVRGMLETDFYPGNQ
jgi:hypothetical protein